MSDICGRRRLAKLAFVNGVSGNLRGFLEESESKVIDSSGDFRLTDPFAFHAAFLEVEDASAHGDSFHSGFLQRASPAELEWVKQQSLPEWVKQQSLLFQEGWVQLQQKGWFQVMGWDQQRQFVTAWTHLLKQALDAFWKGGGELRKDAFEALIQGTSDMFEEKEDATSEIGPDELARTVLNNVQPQMQPVQPAQVPMVQPNNVQPVQPAQVPVWFSAFRSKLSVGKSEI